MNGTGKTGSCKNGKKANGGGGWRRSVEVAGAGGALRMGRIWAGVPKLKGLWLYVDCKQKLTLFFFFSRKRRKKKTRRKRYVNSFAQSVHERKWRNLSSKQGQCQNLLPNEDHIEARSDICQSSLQISSIWCFFHWLRHWTPPSLRHNTYAVRHLFGLLILATPCLL